MPKLSRNVDQKWLETEFSFAICRHTGDKWQSKPLFLSIFDLYSSIVDSVFDCHLPGVISEQVNYFIFWYYRSVEIPCLTCPTWSHFIQDNLNISVYLSWDKYKQS